MWLPDVTLVSLFRDQYGDNRHDVHGGEENSFNSLQPRDIVWRHIIFVIISSGKPLAPIRCQGFTWTNVDISSTGSIWRNLELIVNPCILNQENHFENIVNLILINGPMSYCNMTHPLTSWILLSGTLEAYKYKWKPGHEWVILCGGTVMMGWLTWARTKLRPCCRWHIQIPCFVWKLFYFNGNFTQISDNGLALTRCQAIVWTNYGPVYWCIYVSLGFDELTLWGRVTHMCIGNLTIIGSDNGLSPCRRQAIVWTNAGILLIGPLGTNFSEILIGIQTFSLKNCIWKRCLQNGVYFVSASMS